MLNFSVSFQRERMIPEGNPQQRVGPTIPMLMTTATTIVMVVTTGDNDKLRKGHANLIYTSRFVCRPSKTRRNFAGAMLIFYVSFQFERMFPEGNPQHEWAQRSQ